MSRFAEFGAYDALGLAELIAKGAISAGEVLDEAIARTEALNPRLNAVVTRMYDEARRTLSTAPPAGPFAGVPLLLKDLLHAYAGVPLSCGSAALRNQIPERDSEVVARLRRAGLVVFGKTNVPELGLMQVTEPHAFGPTRNPWALDRSPGGSSGGSAAAVAARLTPIASANDGGGSIRIPAAWCGLFGLKPSRGRVPAGPYYGEVWEGAVADHVLTRSVRDSAAALDAISGPAPGDPYRCEPPPGSFLAKSSQPPSRLRIAFSTRSPIGSDVHPECRAAVESTASLLEELGHSVEAAEPPIDGMQVAKAYLLLYTGQVAADLRWIAQAVGPKAVASQVEPPTRALGLMGEAISAAEYVQSRRSWNDFARAMAEFHSRFDLYLTPTTASLPTVIGEQAQSTLETMALRIVNRIGAGRALRASGLPERLALENLGVVPFTQLANLTGQPAMSVPMHWSADGLPVGVQFMAPLGDEESLLRLARQLEEARPWADRAPPPAASLS